MRSGRCVRPRPSQAASSTRRANRPARPTMAHRTWPYEVAVLKTAGFGRPVSNRQPSASMGCPRCYRAICDPSAEIVKRRGDHRRGESSYRKIGIPKIRRSAASGPARGGLQQPCGRLWWPCGRESRGGVCARVCSVDRSSSRVFSADRSSASDSVTATEPKRAWRHGTCRRFRVPGPTPEFTRLIREPPRPVNATRRNPLRPAPRPVLVPGLSFPRSVAMRQGMPIPCRTTPRTIRRGFL